MSSHFPIEDEPKIRNNRLLNELTYIMNYVYVFFWAANMFLTQQALEFRINRWLHVPYTCYAFKIVAT